MAWDRSVFSGGVIWHQKCVGFYSVIASWRIHAEDHIMQLAMCFQSVLPNYQTWRQRDIDHKLFIVLSLGSMQGGTASVIGDCIILGCCRAWQCIWVSGQWHTPVWSNDFYWEELISPHAPHSMGCSVSAFIEDDHGPKVKHNKVWSKYTAHAESCAECECSTLICSSIRGTLGR